VSALGALSLIVVLGVAAPGLPASDSPVADAAMRGDVETIRSLLREGADVNAAQGDGMTALHWSALNGDVATMRMLLYAGATVEPTTRLGSYTPLHLAAREGRGEAVAVLLEAGSDPTALTGTGVSPLHLAAAAGQVDAVRALIEHGADVDLRDTTHGRTPLIFATAANRIEAMEVLLAAGADVSLATRVLDYVEFAREDGEARQTHRRIKEAAKPPEEEPDRPEQRQATPARGRNPAQPPDPDDPPGRGGRPGRGQEPPPDPDDPPGRGGPPDRAQTQPPDPDDPPTVPTAEPAGGNRPEPPDPVNVPRSLSGNEQIGLQGGLTALHYAARDGRDDAALLLLEAGADINHRSADESSPLLTAAINGNFDLAMTLLERGADPNMVSDDGVAPLLATINIEWALRTWYPQPTASQQQETSYLGLMKALLEAGADPNAATTTHIWYAAYNAGRMGVDFTGVTAFWRAAYGLDVAAMRLLIEHGADPNIATLQLSGGRRRGYDPDDPPGNNLYEPEDEVDPSGLPPVPPGGPNVHPLHAASGVGFGTSRVGQQHRHVPDGWLPAVRYLVEELGIDVNVRDGAGYTPMHNAAGRGDNEMIEFLVKHGGDVTVVSRRGQTTVDMANGPQQRVQPFPETMALLESLGAKNNNNCISC
jgi:ankyrin repeat protein